MNPDSVSIVTGSGGTGCGRAIAQRFAKNGAAVVVADINEQGGNETVRLIQTGGGNAAFFRADVRDEHQVRDLITFAEHTFGCVTTLVNNASGPFHPTSRPNTGPTPFKPNSSAPSTRCGTPSGPCVVPAAAPL
jgi:NAD(P)-dependent dehydrogenase (short-subunit alcohol dehydrogenase family)